MCATYYMSNGSQNTSELFENLRLELRRGCLTLAVLTQLRTERYAYTLRKALADDGLEIDEGTLYPLLRRLESQACWSASGGKRKNAISASIAMSPDGEQVLNQLLAEWQRINTSLNKILQEA